MDGGVRAGRIRIRPFRQKNYHVSTIVPFQSETAIEFECFCLEFLTILSPLYY
jgi:hypothetical protein